jgi:hypothetical protein
MLPDMDDFVFLADSCDAALLLRQRADSLLSRLGLLHNPKKGILTPTQVGDHLGLTIDFDRSEIRAPYKLQEHTNYTCLPSMHALHLVFSCADILLSVRVCAREPLGHMYRRR